MVLILARKLISGYQALKAKQLNFLKFVLFFNTFSTTGIYKSQRIVGLGLSTISHAIIIQIKNFFFKSKVDILSSIRKKKIFIS